MSQEQSFLTFAELAKSNPEAFMAIMSRQASSLTNAGVVKIGMVLDFSAMALPEALKADTTPAADQVAAYASLMEAVTMYETSKATTKLSSEQTTLLGKKVAVGQSPQVLMLKAKPEATEGLFPLSMLGKSPKTVFVVGDEQFMFSEMSMSQFLKFLCGKKFRVAAAEKDTAVIAGKTNGIEYYSKWYTLESI